MDYTSDHKSFVRRYLSFLTLFIRFLVSILTIQLSLYRNCIFMMHIQVLIRHRILAFLRAFLVVDILYINRIVFKN